MRFHFHLFIFTIFVVSDAVLSDLILSKVDRRIDLTSQIVRISSTLKVENVGTDAVSEVLLAFPDHHTENLAHLMVMHNEGRGKQSTASLHIEVVHLKEMPPSLTVYSVSLPKSLGKGEGLTLDVLAVLTHSLSPFPEKITQADIQLVVFQESAYYLTPYAVKFQTLSVKLPDARIESYTKLTNTKAHGAEIKYGPYENVPPLSFEPLVVHFESNQPFAIAEEVVREIEISHWGNVQVTEHYKIVHGGAQIKGEFSRLDYQARPHLRGASAFRHLVAKLPPRSHSVYYRDEIGNISTSHLWGDSRKRELEIEPRYPMFGGWRTSFTIGYGLPLQDFVFVSEGKRFLNISFGCPINELVIDSLLVKVVLPEGSIDTSVSVPFPVKQWQKTKISHLDIVGRPVVVLEKTNVVKEHNQHFQVYYNFNSLSLLTEPLMLISGIFLFFVACIVYMHADMTISKSSASYLAKLQWDEVRAAIQQVQDIGEKFLTVRKKLDLSLMDLSRTGDFQACRAARKAAESLLKELWKELKPVLSLLQSSPQAARILPKVEELIAKERELQEYVMQKHTFLLDYYSNHNRKPGGPEIENRIAPLQQKISALSQEICDVLEVIGGI